MGGRLRTTDDAYEAGYDLGFADGAKAAAALADATAAMLRAFDCGAVALLDDEVAAVNAARAALAAVRPAAAGAPLNDNGGGTIG